MPTISVIELANVARQSLVVELNDHDVRLVVWWQPLCRYWYGSVEIDGTPLARSRRLVLNVGLLARLPAARKMLAGDLVCRPLGADQGDPGPLESEPWGRSHAIFYEMA